jgi:hypothetical protein
MRFASPLLIAVAFVAGCSGGSPPPDPSDTTASSFTSSNWEKLLTCDNGAAVLDVNTAERRDFQFVVRDANIVRYFESQFPGLSLANGRGEFIARNFDRYHPGERRKPSVQL